MFYYLSFVSASAHVNKLFYLLHSRRLGVTWLNSGWWLAACGWLLYALSIPYVHVVTEIAKKFGVDFRCTAYSPRERLWIDFELILTVKVEIRHPVGGPFGGEFSTFVIIPELWRPKIAKPGIFWATSCAFHWKATPYNQIFKILLQKFSPPHRSTLLCSNVANLSDGKSVKSCVIHMTKNSAASETAATAPKMCQGQLPTFGSQCSRFHPNRFTFGRVIAERMKAVLLAHRVFPIFAYGRTINY